MLSHSTTSYQSQIISITCLLTLAATQPAARKKEVLQALPCLLEETAALGAEPWSAAVLNAGPETPQPAPHGSDGWGGLGGDTGMMDHQQKGPMLHSGACGAEKPSMAGRVWLLFGQKL